MNLLNAKIKEWLKRYVPAQILSVVASVLLSVLFFLITDNRILLAYILTLVQTIIFYTYILIADILARYRRYAKEGKKYTWLTFLKDVRNLIIEFGPSEILDIFIVRPAALYLGPLLLGNFAIGIIVGTLVADVIYYIPAILMYEMRKKYLKD